MEKTNFLPVHKPYKSVKREYSSNSSEPDHLSYSYSCVKSFKENQFTIRKLISQKQGQKSTKTPLEPLTFSLSTEEKLPIFQPFYTNVESDFQDNKVKVNKHREQSIDTIPSHTSVGDSDDLEPDFKDVFDINLFVQWMKVQFKQINSLWPFIKSKDYFLPKLCNKNRKMKMEIMLNNVDEDMKCQLRKYVTDLNLCLEERYSLCNESIIEIDITPIISDTVRLQNFLRFLHNFETNKTQTSQRNSSYNKNTLLEKLDTLKNKNECLIYESTQHKYMPNNNDWNSNQEKNVFHKSCSVKFVPIAQQNKETVEPQKNIFITNQKRGTMTKLLSRNEDENRDRYGKCMEMSSKALLKSKEKETLNTMDHSPPAVNIAPNNVKKSRLNYTIAAAMGNDNKLNSGRKYQLNKDNNFQNQLQVFKVTLNNPVFKKKNQKLQNEENDQEDKLTSKTSCKCLIHKEREDYKRFRYQCLFGKGDENSYSLLKQLSMREKASIEKVNHKDTATLYTSSEEDSDTEKGIESCDNQLTTKTESKPLNSNLKANKRKLSLKHSQETLEQCHKNKSIHQNILNKFLLGKVINPGHTNKKEDNKTKVNKKRQLLLDINNNVSSNIKQVTKDKGSSFETLDKNTYHTIHIEDDEELVCAVNYSNTSNTLSLCEDSIKADSNQHDAEDENTNFLKVDACFESLDYSVNSASKNSMRRNMTETSENINYLYSRHENDNSQSTFSQNSSLFHAKSKTKLGNDSIPKLIKGSNVLTVHPTTNNGKSSNKNQHFITKESQGKIKKLRGNKIKDDESSRLEKEAKKLQEDIIDLTEQLYSISKVKINNNTNGKEHFKNYANNKTNNFNNYENDPKILQAKIIDRTKQLYFVTKKQKLLSQNVDQKQIITDSSISVSNSFNTLSQPSSSASIIIRVANVEKRRPKSSCITQGSNKMSLKLNFLKPKKIYRSISSICRKTSGNSIEKQKNENMPQNLGFNTREEKYLQNIVKSESICKEDSKLKLLNNGYDLNVTKNNKSHHGQSNSSQMESTLILNSLERLDLELNSQREEINNLKSLYKQNTEKIQ